MWQLHNGWTVNYRTALGNVVLGRIVKIISARTATLGIRIRGVPESKATTDIAWMQEDLTTIDKILAFPEIEDLKLTRVTGLGNYNPYKGPKRLLFNTETGIGKDLILNDIKAEWLTWASDLYQPRTIDETQKKRKWMSENKKAANQQRLRPKDHSTPKSNAGSTTVENGCPLQKVEEIETGQTGLNRWLQAMTMLTSNRRVPVVPFSCCTVPSTSALKVSQLFIPRLSQQAHRINITTKMNKMRDICFTCNRKEDPDSLVSVCKKVLYLLPSHPPWMYHVHQRWNPSPRQTWWKPSHLQRLLSLQKKRQARPNTPQE